MILFRKTTLRVSPSKSRRRFSGKNPFFSWKHPISETLTAGKFNRGRRNSGDTGNGGKSFGGSCVQLLSGSSRRTNHAQCPAAGHVQELFPNADTREFTGSISVTSTGGPIAGMAILIGVNPGQFTTLPVTPRP
jgi:hypothetical protein